MSTKKTLRPFLLMILPPSTCQGSVAADIGGMVRGDAPQLDSTSLPWWETDTGAGPRDLRAAFSGAMLLNCTRDRQPTKPGVLYFVMRTGSISPVSADDGTEIDRWREREREKEKK